MKFASSVLAVTSLVAVASAETMEGHENLSALAGDIEKMIGSQKRKYD